MHLEPAFSCLFPGAMMAALPVRWDYFRSFSEVDEIKTSVQTSVRARFNKFLLFLFHDLFKNQLVQWATLIFQSYFISVFDGTDGAFGYYRCQTQVFGFVRRQDVAAIVLNTKDNIGPIFHEGVLLTTSAVPFQHSQIIENSNILSCFLI